MASTVIPRGEALEHVLSPEDEKKISYPPINRPPAGVDLNAELPGGFMNFLAELHREFTPRQQRLVEKRKQVLAKAHQGRLPEYLAPSEAITGDWKIELPDWVRDQRNQMTGPADDAELVVKMLNSGAPGVMLDLEDSMANHWPNLMQGVENIIHALYGELTYYDKKREKTVAIAPRPTVIYTRPRGLHISQGGIFEDELTSASLFDTALVAYLADASRLKHPLSFYIPKSESAKEALWWRDLFQALARLKGWKKDYIKAMALVESFPIGYQLDEFVFNLRDHLIGLNLGRWDYMASLIHYHLHDPNWVLADRNTIPHNVPFFQAIRERIPDVCHKRGILAIGGMTALYPSREDPELNERALKVLAEDKKNEANSLMDGAWTGHPDQNQIAIEQFPYPNQIHSLRANPSPRPDLNLIPLGVGRRTIEGTRAAINTVIRYRHGYLSGKGASLIRGYMEDLATDRIYRLMIAQRLRHRDVVIITDEQGKPVKHTPQMICKLFTEEVNKIMSALPADTPSEIRTRYREARKLSEQMIKKENFNPR